MQQEIWKDIPEYDGLYQVSNLGNVKSFFFGKERILKQTSDKKGYLYVALKGKKIRVHQLVAIAFLNHKPCGLKYVVDHINDVKFDNRLENLQVVTNRFNIRKTQGSGSSQYKGVHWCKTSSRWISSIRINGKRNRLGSFKNEYDAHLAYQNKLKEL